MSRHVKYAILAGVSAVAFALAGANAQPGGGGGSGGGAGAGAQSGDQGRIRDRIDVPDQDRDRDQDRGLMDTPDQDRDRDRDQDRLAIPDQDRDRDRLFLGTADRIQQHDRDGDGKVDRAEFDAWHDTGFDTMDADGNGLTLQEYHAMRMGQGPYGSPDAELQVRMRTQANLRKTERYRLMDTDANGVVMRNEYRNFAEYAFLEADADDDGKLTVQELNRFNRGM